MILLMIFFNFFGIIEKKTSFEIPIKILVSGEEEQNFYSLLKICPNKKESSISLKGFLYFEDEKISIPENVFYFRFYPITDFKEIKNEEKYYFKFENEDGCADFDLKIKNLSFLRPGSYSLKILIEMKNLNLEKKKAHNLVLKKTYVEKFEPFKIFLELENHSNKTLKNITLKEFQDGMEIFKIHINELKVGDVKILNYSFYPPNNFTGKFYTNTEVEYFEREYERKYFIESGSLFEMKRGNIWGKILFKDNIYQIDDIAIFLDNGRMILPDEDGNYHINGIIPGYHMIYIKKNEIILKEKLVYVSPLSQIREDFIIEKEEKINNSFTFFSGCIGIWGRKNFFDLNLDGFFQIESSFLNGDISITDREESRRSFYKDRLYYIYDLPMWGDLSIEKKKSFLKRKFSLDLSFDKILTKISYGFSYGTLEEDPFLKFYHLGEGINANYENDNIYYSLFFESFGTKLHKDNFKGNNTTGPFYLSHFPVLYSTEEVYIEIYDSFLKGRLISRKELMKNRDYIIYYEKGIINLKEPLFEYTPEGNLIFLFVKYETVPDEKIKSDYAISSQIFLKEKNGKDGLKFFSLNSNDEIKSIAFFGDKKINNSKLLYEIAFQGKDFKENAYILKYEFEKGNIFFQSISKDFQNPTNYNINSGTKEGGFSLKLKDYEFMLSLGNNYDEKEKKHLFFSRLLWKKNFRWGYFWQNFTFQEIKQEKEIEYLQGLKYKNFSFGWKKGPFSSFLSFGFEERYKKIEIQHTKFENYSSTLIIGSLFWENNYASLNVIYEPSTHKNLEIQSNFNFDFNEKKKFQISIQYNDKLEGNPFYIGSQFITFNNLSSSLFSFLDGRVYGKKEYGSYFLDLAIGFRPFEFKKTSIFSFCHLDSSWGNEDKENNFLSFGMNFFPSKESSFLIQGTIKKDNNNGGFLFEKFFNWGSVFAKAQILSNLSFKKNYGIGLMINLNKRYKWIFGYNFSSFPAIYPGDPFPYKKGFYSGIILPLNFSSVIKEELPIFKPKEILVSAPPFIKLNERKEIELKVLDEKGNLTKYFGKITMKGINDKGEKKEFKLNFRKKDNGILRYTLYFDDPKSLGNWVFSFYWKGIPLNGNFSIILIEKEEELEFPYIPLSYYSKPKKMEEKECITPEKIKISYPPFAMIGEKIKISLKIVSREEKICIDFEGEILVYNMDGELLAKVYFGKNDKGEKDIYLKFEKIGEFFIMAYSKQNPTLAGIGNIIKIGGVDGK